MEIRSVYMGAGRAQQDIYFLLWVFSLYDKLAFQILLIIYITFYIYVKSKKYIIVLIWKQNTFEAIHMTRLGWTWQQNF